MSQNWKKFHLIAPLEQEMYRFSHIVRFPTDEKKKAKKKNRDSNADDIKFQNRQKVSITSLG